MVGPVRYHLGAFPPTDIEWRRLVPAIGEARAALARYDSAMASIADPSIVLSPLTVQEAVLSSKIEGAAVTMAEVLRFEAGAGPALSPPRQADAEEVINYRTALRFAAGELKERKLSQALVLEAHALLMRGARDRDKSPGEFRARQNWVGAPGSAIEQASFVPIPQAELQSGVDAWCAYIEDGGQPDPLVQLAIAHAEFEALHPFQDGNGRLGRLLIPLFLHARGLLGSPCFCMSGYFEARRELYIDALRAVSREGAWTEWCAFFLAGVIEQAAENQQRAEALNDLSRWTQTVIARATHSDHAQSAVDFLFANPIFSSSHFVQASRIARPTALRLLQLLSGDGILDRLSPGAGSRPAFYAFTDLLDLAEGKVADESIAQ